VNKLVDIYHISIDDEKLKILIAEILRTRLSDFYSIVVCDDGINFYQKPHLKLVA